MNPLAPVIRTGPACGPAGWIIMRPIAWEAAAVGRYRVIPLKERRRTSSAILRPEPHGALVQTRTATPSPAACAAEFVEDIRAAAALKFFAAIHAALSGTRHVRPSSADGKVVSRAPKSRMKTPEACPESGGHSATPTAAVGVMARFDSEPSDPGRSPRAPKRRWPLVLRRLEMAYLDVSPMIVALRTSPSDFEMKRGWLRHFPSRHEFKFDSEGNVRP